jgi:hypothetical protein
VTALEGTSIHPSSTPSHLPLTINSTPRPRYSATPNLSTFDNMEPSHRLNSKSNPPFHIKKPHKFILTDMDSSIQVPKEYIQELKAFLLKYDIHKSNRPNTGILYSNPSLQFTSRNRQYVERTHYHIYPPTTQLPPSQWSGTALAKKQSFQEQKTFAKRQCVRFVVSGNEGSSTSCNDYGDDDEDDDEDKDGEKDTQAKQPWKFSKLAKIVEGWEREAFKTGSTRHACIRRHRCSRPYPE